MCWQTPAPGCLTALMTNVRSVFRTRHVRTFCITERSFHWCRTDWRLAHQPLFATLWMALSSQLSSLCEPGQQLIEINSFHREDESHGSNKQVGGGGAPFAGGPLASRHTLLYNDNIPRRSYQVPTNMKGRQICNHSSYLMSHWISNIGDKCKEQQSVNKQII